MSQEGALAVAARPARVVSDRANPLIPGGGLLLQLLTGRGAAIADEPDAALAEAGQSYRQFLDALGVAVYTTDAEGHITFYNDAAAEFWGRRPKLGELWCGSLRLYWPDGSPMPHEACPMAVTLTERRAVRGGQAIAERPDGSRVSFVPFPSPLQDGAGNLVGGVNVLIDVTERTRAETALRDAADALAASNAVKDEFLGLISHELRTPVTTIFGNAQLLRERGDRLEPDKRRSMAADIAHDSERLLGVVENLLLLTRIESGSGPDPEPQLLGHVVRRTIDVYRRRHPERPLSLACQPGHLVVDADRSYLELLVENLLSNADKYSPEGCEIEICVRSSSDEAQVTVLDRGIGLTKAELSKLFTPFYRTEAAKKRSGGVGIGLAACKRVVETLGGRIWARRRAGGGSEFGFALPLSYDPGDPA